MTTVRGPIQHHVLQKQCGIRLPFHYAIPPRSLQLPYYIANMGNYCIWNRHYLDLYETTSIIEHIRKHSSSTEDSLGVS
jgi:hypothetical protein